MPHHKPRRRAAHICRLRLRRFLAHMRRCGFVYAVGTGWEQDAALDAATDEALITRRFHCGFAGGEPPVIITPEAGTVETGDYASEQDFMDAMAREHGALTVMEPNGTILRGRAAFDRLYLNTPEYSWKPKSRVALDEASMAALVGDEDEQEE